MKNKHPPTNLTGFLNRIYERSTEVGALKKRLAAQQVELESTRAQNAQLLDALTAAAYDLEEDIVKYSSQQTSLENLTSSNKSLQSSLESVQVELAKEKSDSESYRLRVTELESSLGTLKTNLDHSSADYELRIQGLEKQL
jgi:predicted  nucleic acid-binding Zn-ribbon protein